MAQLLGIGVSPGVVIAPAWMMAPAPPLVDTRAGEDDVPAAMSRVDTAIAEIAETLVLRAKDLAAPISAVLEAQALIVRDPVLRDAIEAHLVAGQSLATSVELSFDGFAEQLASAGAYLADRVADLHELSYQLRARLLGVTVPVRTPLDGPRVVIAEEISPADLVTLGPFVAALVTQRGGATGHTAIVAKSLGLPAVVGCAGALDLPEGARVLVDGRSGVVLADPSEQIVEARLAEESAYAARVAQAAGAGRTADGTPVALLANLAGDHKSLAGLDCEGVGLFRTEFLYLDRHEAPSFDEQVEVYSHLLVSAAGRRVVIRTIDAGADKPLAFVDVGEEMNPALGVRGYRIVRHGGRDLVEQQLRAIATAARGVDAPVSVMAPMVSTVGEVREFVELARSHGLSDVGVMAEVPALVLAAEEVVQECDFISVGTNDLAQYTFAADRLLDELADLLDPWQPALLRLVDAAARAARRFDRKISVCGEAASDPQLAAVLVGLGVDSLSMGPVSIPGVRALLAHTDMDRCREAARAALAARDAVAGHSAAAAILDGKQS